MAASSLCSGWRCSWPTAERRSRSIVEAKDYALAVAAQPFMGHAGFVLIAVAAMLSTASAINATLYGAARINYIIAKDGELPKLLEHKVWNKPVEGLLVTAGLTLLAANLFSLESISMMGSAGFLVIFIAVNIVNVVRHRQTGSRLLISMAGAIACTAALGALIWQRAGVDPSSLWVLAAILVLSVAIEAGYRLLTGRQLQSHLPRI